jgi:hypothetical protein
MDGEADAGNARNGDGSDQERQAGGADDPVRGWLDGDQLLFLPAHPRRRGARDQIELETRVTAEGTRFAMAFTSLDLLVEALGEFQPWIGAAAGKLPELLVGCDAAVQLNPSVHSMAPRWTAEDVARKADGGEVPF